MILDWPTRYLQYCYCRTMDGMTTVYSADVFLFFIFVHNITDTYHTYQELIRGEGNGSLFVAFVSTQAAFGNWRTGGGVGYGGEHRITRGRRRAGGKRRKHVKKNKNDQKSGFF